MSLHCICTYVVVAGHRHGTLRRQGVALMAVCSRGRVSLVRSPTTRCFNPSLTLMRDYLDGNLRSSAVGCSSAPLSVLRNLSASAAKETDIHAWENEYADLKVNWFPGHMVKATNAIREKLKHVSCGVIAQFLRSLLGLWHMNLSRKCADNVRTLHTPCPSQT